MVFPSLVATESKFDPSCVVLRGLLCRNLRSDLTWRFSSDSVVACDKIHLVERRQADVNFPPPRGRLTRSLHSQL